MPRKVSRPGCRGGRTGGGLFSQINDVVGLLVRGGTVDDALSSLKRGLRDVFATWTGKELSRDKATEIAELLGTVEHQSALSVFNSGNDSVYQSKFAKRFSDSFFKYTGLEPWSRATRTVATVAALNFIKTHATKPGEHSQRWLTELGLTADDVKIDANGDLLLTKEEYEAVGLSKDGAAAAEKKIRAAVNQWVDGAVLRPNSAIRPSWASDPRWSLVFYLKQFGYAFQKTFLSRIAKEYQYGNVAPALALAPAIPIAIGADIMRGMIQTGGDLPSYMKGWNAADYLSHGIQRTGLLGPYVEDAANPADLLGPVANQALDAFTNPIGETLRKATPGLSLVKN